MEKFIHNLFTDEILMEAGRLFGVKLCELSKIGGFENYIYGYRIQNTEYILRLSHSSHRSIEQVEAELDFVNYLAINKANVSVPVLSINKRLVEKVICKDDSYFIITSYIKALGKQPSRNNTTEKFFQNYGKTIGQFHRLTKFYTPGKNKRISWNEDPLLLNAQKYLPKEDYIIYEKFTKLVDYILTLPQNNDNYGLIHTDIHMGNFFVENDNLCVFDFDDAAYMYLISDIAIALFYFIHAIHDEEIRINMAEMFMGLFMKGYNEENKLTRENFLTINHFLKLREYVLYIVLHRSCDLETDNFAKSYVNYYRERLINDVPFVSLDFSKYL